MMSRAFLFAAVLSFASSAVVAAPDAASALSANTSATTPSTWNGDIQGKRITALCEDARGRVFAASEENGVWMRGRSGAWSGYTPQKSSIASDMIYALAVDKQDRVWAGTARHGVSVFNGRSWKNFDSLKVPVGERVFDIAVNPLDESVWIASNIGLTRYDVKDDKWTTLYPTSKLPLSHLQSLAFSAKGVLFAGTQTDGLLISQPLKTVKGDIEYSKWRKVVAPNVVPDVANGVGLPSNMINDVLVGKDNTVYVATTTGLAWSKDNGATWSYKRGSDYIEKAKQRLVPVVFKDAPSTDGTLNEDYIASLAQDATDNIWIAHWRQGYEVWDAKLENRILNAIPAPAWRNDLKTDDALSNGDGDYVKCLFIAQDGTPLIGRYGAGLTVAPKMFISKTATTKVTTTKSATSNVATSSTRSVVVPIDASVAPVYPAFPSPQSAPTLAELNALLKQLGTFPMTSGKNAPSVVALDDDWSTRGDWLGRYGKYWANLCAGGFDGDFIWGAGYKKIRYASRIGKNADKADSLRYWVHWLYTDNPNSLEMAPTYFDAHFQMKLTSSEKYRRQSEVDCHGEEYPYQKDGPHVYVSLQIPQGDFVLSLPNFNKDGDRGDNRKRDYRVSIRPHNKKQPLENIDDFHQQPELATARFRDFRSSVWKRFLVRGPQELTIEVSKNYSLNTILAGVMLDELKEKPAPYFRTVAQDRVLDAKLDKAAQARKTEIAAVRTKRFAAASNEVEAANRIFAELDWLRLTNPTWWAQSSRKFYQPLTLWMQEAQSTAKSQSIKADGMQKLQTRLATCYWALRMFEKSEQSQRQSGLTPARDIEKSLKWDGLSRGSEQGYETVTEYLAQQREKEVPTKIVRRVP